MFPRIEAGTGDDSIMSENEHETVRFGVIMAGGAGERFWPLSRRDRPKQLLNLTAPDRSMLAQAVDRLCPVVPPDRIYVITGAHLVEPIRAAGVGVPDANVVAEPMKRNTAGALCYITAHILAAHPDLAPDRVAIAVSTADHDIGDDALFARTVAAALDAAEREGALVICGIRPAGPETGFGYIEARDEPVFTAGGEIAVLPVQAFHEKPDRERAEAFVADGNYYWNSGMFFWTAAAFLDELRGARPEMAQAVEALRAALARGDARRAGEVFAGLEDISIDYALMEHASRVLMVRGTFPWSDVGSWPSLEQIHPRDERGNVVAGEAVLFDAADCVVCNAAASGRMAVGVAGVSGLVVVVTDDAVLVVPKDRAQDVRHIVNELKQRGAPQL
jgi:mannose-1-phosphate guanylyltransferase